MKALRLLPEVLEDTARAARRYDEEGYPGLGDRFLAVFYSSLPCLQKEGEIYRLVYKDFRRILLNPFPYAVYYRYHENWVVISLVIHGARSPRLVRRLLSFSFRVFGVVRGLIYRIQVHTFHSITGAAKPQRTQRNEKQALQSPIRSLDRWKRPLTPGSFFAILAFFAVYELPFFKFIVVKSLTPSPLSRKNSCPPEMRFV